MSRYLLDTSTLVDFSKGYEPVRTRVLALIEASDVVGTCAVVVAEFYSGLPPDVRPSWDRFFASLTYWEITREVAAMAGQDRYDFARRGQARATTDLLVAAVARQNDAIIVTDNAKDFPGSGVRLLSLRS